MRLPADRTAATQAKRLLRDWRIADAWHAGVPLKDIAERFHLTPQRVGQILKEYRP